MKSSFNHQQMAFILKINKENNKGSGLSQSNKVPDNVQTPLKKKKKSMRKKIKT